MFRNKSEAVVAEKQSFCPRVVLSLTRSLGQQPANLPQIKWTRINGFKIACVVCLKSCWARRTLRLAKRGAVYESVTVFSCRTSRLFDLRSRKAKFRLWLVRRDATGGAGTKRVTSAAYFYLCCAVSSERDATSAFCTAEVSCCCCNALAPCRALGTPQPSIKSSHVNQLRDACAPGCHE